MPVHLSAELLLDVAGGNITAGCGMVIMGDSGLAWCDALTAKQINFRLVIRPMH
jgi:hypothetical protein